MSIRASIILVCTMITIIVASTCLADNLSKYRERTSSDDAQTKDEVFFHGDARALVIMNIEPNKLRVGGRELRVKRNPVSKGCFVYDPRTRFFGVKRYLVWWVLKEDKAYPLNSPSKMVTPGLKWPRDEGVDAPSASEVIAYVFEGKPMTGTASSSRPAAPEANMYTVKEYRIYRAVINTPMSVPEDQAIERAAKRYGVTAEAVQKATKKVQGILHSNKWFSSPDSEIRYASNWQGEKP